MARLSLRFGNSPGINKDKMPSELALEEFSEGINFRIKDGRVEFPLGHKAIWSAGRPDNLYFLWPWNSGQGSPVRWFVLEKVNPTQAMIHGVAGTDENFFWSSYLAPTELDITNALPPSPLELNGVPILVISQQEKPQVYNETTAQFEDIGGNWPSGVYCDFMRPFRNRLIAFKPVIPNGTWGFTNPSPYDYYRKMLLWSGIATPGNQPGEWDPTNVNDTARYNDLSINGEIIGAEELGDYMIVYCSDRVIRMTPTASPVPGRTFAFPVAMRGESYAPSHRDAVVLLEINGVQVHAVMTRDDVYLYDLQSTRSLLKGRLRDYLSSITPDLYKQDRRMVWNNYHKELMICYPIAGRDEKLMEAIVWNAEDNSLAIRQLPALNSISSGQYENLPHASKRHRVIGINDAAFGGSNSVYLFGELDGDNGLDVVAYQAPFVGRKKLAAFGQDQRGQPMVDPSMDKTYDLAWPLQEGSISQWTFEVSNVLNPDTTSNAVTQTFYSDVDEKIDLNFTGKYLNWRATLTTTTKLIGFLLEVAKVGGRHNAI